MADEVTTAPTPGVAADTMSSAVKAAVDELTGEGPDAGADGPAKAAAPAKQVETPPAAAVEPQESEVLRELQAFSRAQERWGGERGKLIEQAQRAAQQAKADVLAALASEDPDGELERLGVSQEDRRTLARRMVLRHVPESAATGELKQQIREENVRAEIRALKQRIDRQDQERIRERQEISQRQQVEQSLKTLHDAFRDAGDDLKLVKARYGKRSAVVINDALEVGKEMSAKGEISTRMTEPEIARRIAQRLNERYADEFGIGGEPSTSSAAAASTAKASETRQAETTQKAAEVSAARTITREATGATRPPPPDPRSEDEWLREEANEFARLRREGKFNHH